MMFKWLHESKIRMVIPDTYENNGEDREFRIRKESFYVCRQYE